MTIKTENKNDNWYTKKSTVKLILPFIKPNSNILCPFDNKDSNFVKILKENGHNVWYSHINGDNNTEINDFFNYNLNNINKFEFDYIISNPPFSLRKQVIEHLEFLAIPYIILMPIVSIALKDIRKYIENIYLIAFNKRLKFFADNGIECKNPPSETAFFCSNCIDKNYFIEIGDK